MDVTAAINPHALGTFNVFRFSQRLWVQSLSELLQLEVLSKYCLFPGVRSYLQHADKAGGDLFGEAVKLVLGVLPISCTDNGEIDTIGAIKTTLALPRNKNCPAASNPVICCCCLQPVRSDMVNKTLDRLRQVIGRELGRLTQTKLTRYG